MIALIGEEFRDQIESDQLRTSTNSADNSYQAGFKFLLGRKGQTVANEIVQRSVVLARKDRRVGATPPLADEQCRALEADNAGWHLSSGLSSIGSLISQYPQTFGGRLLTTNFDPCIQIAIHRAGGRSWRTALHGDGNLSQTEAEGCHVIHLHGYWWGSDTLHTMRQLTQERPRLTASLAELLRNKLLVVSGYGGWNDVVTRSIFDVVRDDTAAPEVLWLFKGSMPNPSPFLKEQLSAGIDRGRVSLYSEIDCNVFFPSLHQAWTSSGIAKARNVQSRTNPVVVSAALQASLARQADQQRQVEGDTEDRPPEFSICVGREDELGRLSKSTARVIFITGMGGQGKSTLAAQYFRTYKGMNPDHLLVWRDCKEIGETFENQIISAIEGLTQGRIDGTDLAQQSTEAIIDVLMGLIVKRSVLFVFDNVDNFVDSEKGRLTSSADLLIQRLLLTTSASQVLFTCRPQVEYEADSLLSLHLRGITLDASRLLFAFRGGQARADEIEAAHQFTNGHALWLDLLALQTRRVDQTLTVLLSQIGDLPENTLANIWSRLKDTEKLALQVLAETVKPSSPSELGDYLQDWMNFNKAMKAIRSLRSQNLVVVKELKDRSEVLELHPLIRQFVRVKFPLVERKSFMRAIIGVYVEAIKKYFDALESRPPFTILQNWTQKAELDISAGDLSEACLTLSQVSKAFAATAFAREFTRTVRILLDSFDWVKKSSEVGDFDVVLEVHIECLSYLGDLAEVDSLLGQYSTTVSTQEIRYINFCSLKCFTSWVRKDFTDAVQWGKKGVALADQQKVRGRTDISHRLALAQRDAGNPEIALEYFAKGSLLSEVIDPDELQEEKGAAFYGNIGRCYHFMGQVQVALICYQKSALLLEKNRSNDQTLNQGYVRWWVGELLLARNQHGIASAFIEAARLKWHEAAPGLEQQLIAWRDSFALSVTQEDADSVERICRSWVMGADLDVSHSR